MISTRSSRQFSMCHSPCTHRPAFTLVEMLMVIGIIALLLSMVLLIGQSSINDAREKDTRMLLGMLDNGIKAFADLNPYKSVRAATERYGPYPPDDLMAFTIGQPSTGAPMYTTGEALHGLTTSPQLRDLVPNLMPGAVGTYISFPIAATMEVLTDDLNAAAPDDYVAQGDGKALSWGLRAHPETRTIYENIPSRFIVTRPTTGAGSEYFDQNANGSFDPLVDKDVTYFVDGWGTPINYFSAINLREGVALDDATETEATPHGWLAQRMVTLNNKTPVLVSYGIDGEVQKTSALEKEYSSRVLGIPGPAAASGDPLFVNVQHEDNIYVDVQFKEKLATLKVP
ncbi:MAG: hypothetical protein HJJLKODD_01941 [Phycisphaerae bacterium]|nr:hypothetical protein [Phycisphaerae bacterium]